MQRNLSIDFGRFVAAFLVVIIHVNLFVGHGFLLQFARIAVPFFYIISGYYLFTPHSAKLKMRLVNSIKKWGRMWLTYILIVGAIVTIW